MTRNVFILRTGGLVYTKSRYSRVYFCTVPQYGEISGYSVERLCQRVIKRQAAMARAAQQEAQNRYTELNAMGVSLV